MGGTGGHFLTIARHQYGGAGPDGSDAAGWLLRYGAHSEHLRDFVAQLARVIANSPIQREFI